MEKIIYGVVKRSIPAKTSKSTRSHMEISHKDWKDMADEIDKYIEMESENLQIIGWFHTHPNNLEVFMSGIDLTTQRMIFSQDWQFAVVFNPHRKRWKVFHGRDADECQGDVIKNIPIHYH